MKLLCQLFFLIVALFFQLPASIALAEEHVVRIEDEHFTFRLDERSRFISAAETVRILIDTGAYSSAEVQEQNPLGMIVEKNFNPASGLPGIVITATHEGHIEDTSAQPIKEISRHALGQPNERVLHYAVRVLGRENAIHFRASGSGEHMDSLQQVMRQMLTSAAFDRGYRYQDFNARYHRVAKYGLIPNESKFKTVFAAAPILLFAAIIGLLFALGRWVTRRRLPEF